jgi:hypothetical protein
VGGGGVGRNRIEKMAGSNGWEGRVRKEGEGRRQA